jgi:hypothetical protein
VASIYDPSTDEEKPARDFGADVPMSNDPGGKPLDVGKDLSQALGTAGRLLDGNGKIEPDDYERMSR